MCKDLFDLLSTSQLYSRPAIQTFETEQMYGYSDVEGRR